MSVIDFTDPYNLLAPYTQAMILCLLWNEQPEGIHSVGFGGGRVPMVLHHLLPTTRIDATDIEPALVEISSKFFGVRFDERLHLLIQDGRTHLEEIAGVNRFDVILLDVFRGSGAGVYRFCTREFFEICKRCLSPGGQVYFNLFESDPLYRAKIFTFQQAFPQAILYRWRRENVLIGMDRPSMYPGEMFRRAEELQCRYPLRFSLTELVYHLHMPEKIDELLAGYHGPEILDQPNMPEAGSGLD